MSDALAKLYPELASAGGLAPALNALLAGLGTPVRAQGLDTLLARTGGGSPYWAWARHGRREAQLSVASEERRFHLSVMEGGLSLAQGGAETLAQVAQALEAALGRALPSRELCAQLPFLRRGPGADAIEAGPAGYTEARWQQLLAEHDPREVEGSLIEACAREPALRQLFPYRSHATLGFSRCTGHPFSGDCPRIDPIPDGSYRVNLPDGRAERVRGAEEAARLAVAHLPAGCGPALHGTADDLDAPS
jgi:hypothetical protein